MQRSGTLPPPGEMASNDYHYDWKICADKAILIPVIDPGFQSTGQTGACKLTSCRG